MCENRLDGFSCYKLNNITAELRPELSLRTLAVFRVHFVDERVVDKVAVHLLRSTLPNKNGCVINAEILCEILIQNPTLSVRTACNQKQRIGNCAQSRPYSIDDFYVRICAVSCSPESRFVA